MRVSLLQTCRRACRTQFQIWKVKIAEKHAPASLQRQACWCTAGRMNWQYPPCKQGASLHVIVACKLNCLQIYNILWSVKLGKQLGKALNVGYLMICGSVYGQRLKEFRSKWTYLAVLLLLETACYATSTYTEIIWKASSRLTSQQVYFWHFHSLILSMNAIRPYKKIPWFSSAAPGPFFYTCIL